MKHLLKVYITFLVFPVLNGLLNFKLNKGRKIKDNVAYNMNVPTVYQCAEICLGLQICKSLNFDKMNKRCYISTKIWTQLNNHSDFIYAEKDAIPKVSILSPFVIYKKYLHVNSSHTVQNFIENTG